MFRILRSPCPSHSFFCHVKPHLFKRTHYREGRSSKNAQRKQLTHTSQTDGILCGTVCNVAAAERERRTNMSLESFGMHVRYFCFVSP